MLLRTLKAPDRKNFVFSLWEPSGFSSSSRYCDGYAAHRLDVCSRSAIAEVLRDLNSFIAANAIEALIPAGILATYFLAHYQSSLVVPSAFPLPEPEVIYRLNNKWAFYELVKSLHVPTPVTLRVRQPEQLAALDIRYPVIIKPSVGGNSKGVVRCQSQRDLEAYLKANKEADSGYLIEDLIPGKDAVFGFLALKGEIKAWTLHTKERHSLRFFGEPRILRMAEKIIAHTGYSGLGNFDLMIREDVTDNFFFLECNPRIWASFGISCAYGVDFFQIGNQLRKSGCINPLMMTHVVKDCEVPYPSSGKFMRSWLQRPYDLPRGAHARLAWRTLLDPLPTIIEWLRMKKMDELSDDTAMLDVLRNFLGSRQ